MSWSGGAIFAIFAWLIHLITEDSAQKSPSLHREDVYNHPFKILSPYINITIYLVVLVYFSESNLVTSEINLFICEKYTEGNGEDMA